ncbi:hypothetical protein OT109_14140 [Phycisphaeraceae bacterium D3-23]
MSRLDTQRATANVPTITDKQPKRYNAYNPSRFTANTPKTRGLRPSGLRLPRSTQQAKHLSWTDPNAAGQAASSLDIDASQQAGIDVERRSLPEHIDLEQQATGPCTSINHTARSLEWARHHFNPDTLFNERM